MASEADFPPITEDSDCPHENGCCRGCQMLKLRNEKRSQIEDQADSIDERNENRSETEDQADRITVDSRWEATGAERLLKSLQLINSKREFLKNQMQQIKDQLAQGTDNWEESEFRQFLFDSNNDQLGFQRMADESHKARDEEVVSDHKDKGKGPGTARTKCGKEGTNLSALLVSQPSTPSDVETEDCQITRCELIAKPGIPADKKSKGKLLSRGPRTPVDRNGKGKQKSQEPDTPVDRKGKGKHEDQEPSAPVDRKGKGKQQSPEPSAPVDRKGKGKQQSPEPDTPIDRKGKRKQQSPEPDTPIDRKGKGKQQSPEPHTPVDRKGKGKQQSPEPSTPVDRKGKGKQQKQEPSAAIKKMVQLSQQTQEAALELDSTPPKPSPKTSMGPPPIPPPKSSKRSGKAKTSSKIVSAHPPVLDTENPHPIIERLARSLAGLEAGGQLTASSVACSKPRARPMSSLRHLLGELEKISAAPPVDSSTKTCQVCKARLWAPCPVCYPLIRMDPVSGVIIPEDAIVGPGEQRGCKTCGADILLPCLICAADEEMTAPPKGGRAGSRSHRDRREMRDLKRDCESVACRGGKGKLKGRKSNREKGWCVRWTWRFKGQIGEGEELITKPGAETARELLGVE